MVHTLLFVANIIGKLYTDYARFVLLLVALKFMYSNPLWFVGFYGLSAFLDVFDGMAARALN